MPYEWQTVAEIVRRRVVGIIRTDSAAEAVRVADALVCGGLSVVEVSLTTPGGLDAVRELATRAGATVGAGTVIDAASARLSILAGARFLVSPTVVPEVIATGRRYGVPTLAGAQSPTEAMAAVEAGAALVKLFPAGHLGPGYLKAVRAALPQVGFVPTGGVNSQNVADWLAAGAVAVGVGGALTTGADDEITVRAIELLGNVSKVFSPELPAPHPLGKEQ
ncbi:bifunctional 4-hydroxy-2-oxoglutarate aldolase/2-dehydro-3-deoxy-phosphogluconate aldolase [Micromonospora mirobrigensis]|uniref:2-dehydro-3-deoxyphosphogluconate aldolase / (4S)-4-hydroxy-2-oxoglutarate aldolase n=1 Tax=Micromonospora mirobrigensis TaxID=262898 RepID=A0A1C5AKI4_9ACTN|nr:bifunctional 4-hydroxy-2-oxoglutarate aldolase/2-dehydro-3-deoxy-phosphogluconate aldolase [Micromonospora mirobrigensis]SCF45709.1 2-dehydro-3-deoxyphosphogluconate aldolase / (4S)-4-hydroxy-2-oxoglutarate aldolase [Micromonospora mirobrigensis]